MLKECIIILFTTFGHLYEFADAQQQTFPFIVNTAMNDLPPLFRRFDDHAFAMACGFIWEIPD